MAILRIRDSDGNWIELPTVRGERGFVGPPGEDGSDANVTKSNVEDALGFSPKEYKAGDNITIDGNTISAIDTVVDISGKVDKVTGKGLSTKDYTSTDKQEVAKVKDKADRSYVDEELGKKASTIYVDNRFDNLEIGGGDVDLGPVFKQLDDKVDKIVGKGLTTNDYTNEDKVEVAKVKNKADKDFVDSSLKAIDDNLNKVTKDVNELDLKKQDKLTAGDNISIEGNVVSSTADEGLTEEAVKKVKVDSAKNADTVSGFTVAKDIPADAKLTDTIYDDELVLFHSEEATSLLPDVENNRYLTEEEVRMIKVNSAKDAETINGRALKVKNGGSFTTEELAPGDIGFIF